MLGLIYGEDGALTFVRNVMRAICHRAYAASILLAGEKGRFAYFERDRYLQSEFIRTLPDGIPNGIAQHGIRNSHLLAIAPTGTISLLAGNVSSGLEPIFDACYNRKILGVDGTLTEFTVTDYALDFWRQMNGTATGLPPAFVTAASLPVAHTSTPRPRSSHRSTTRSPRPSTFPRAVPSTNSSGSTISLTISN